MPNYELHDVTVLGGDPTFVPGRELKYPERQVWVLETTHGYYPIGTWGFAANLGSDEAEARTKLEWWLSKNPDEYRLYNNHTEQIITVNDYEQYSYCKEWYPTPVSLHHSTDECDLNINECGASAVSQ
jgi:hypothetical protein